MLACIPAMSNFTGKSGPTSGSGSWWDPPLSVINNLETVAFLNDGMVKS